MVEKLFIPSKIKVGYVHRTDTYLKKLSYVIYFDNKGVLRKEKSWESWRDKTIPAEEFVNEPHSGFVLNKDVKRDGYWGNGHNMVRIYDDRGIEFEITPANLLFILMTTNCHKRGLEGEFVYAWAGKELILLPTGCEEYKTSQKFTDIQDGKVAIKELIPGCSYKTKQLEDLIYLGKFNWYSLEYNSINYRDRINDEDHYYKKTKVTKPHIFVNEKGQYTLMTNANKLGAKITDVPVTNYAELMEKLSNKLFSSKPVKLELKPLDVTKLDKPSNNSWGFNYPFFKECNGIFVQYDISINYKRKSNSSWEYLEPKEIENYRILSHYIITINNEGFKIKNTHEKYSLSKIVDIFGNTHNMNNINGQLVVKTKEDLLNLDFQDLYIILENGRKVKYGNYTDSNSSLNGPVYERAEDILT